MRFDTRIDIGEGADRAGNGAGCNIGPGRFQPLTAASEFGVCFRHFEPESHGFGMNAVAAADSRGQLVLKSAALDDVQQLRSEAHTSELQSLMRSSSAVFC